MLSWINGKLEEKCGYAELLSFWDPWTTWVLKGVTKRKLSDIQVTTLFGVNNFQNIWAMKVIFFFKMEKTLCRFGNAKEIWENIFGFGDNCIWTCSENWTLLRGEFMWSAVNMLPNSPKIPDLTKRDFF